MFRNLQQYFFLFAILLLRFPPIYIFGIHHVAGTSHILATCIMILLFFISFPRMYLLKFPKINLEIILLLLFFATQSISIISAINIPVYLSRFSKICTGVIIFLLGRYYLSKYKKTQFRHNIFLILLLGALIALILQFILYFNPDFYTFLGQIFIYENVLNITETNYDVGKLFDDSYIEIVIPVIFYFLSTSTYFYKIIISSGIFILFAMLSFISNFRYRLVAFFFSSIFSFVAALQKLNKYLLLLLTAMVPIILFFYLDSFILHRNNYTIVDRFLLEDESDVNSITWRVEMYYESITMAKNNFWGVGLGNFYDNLSDNSPTFSNPVSKAISLGALTSGSHNIFFHTLAESGFIGLISLILLLGYYALMDIQILKSNDLQKKILSGSFWTLIIIAQFFPAINLTFYVLFFLLRSLI